MRVLLAVMLFLMPITAMAQYEYWNCEHQTSSFPLDVGSYRKIDGPFQIFIQGIGAYRTYSLFFQETSYYSYTKSYIHHPTHNGGEASENSEEVYVKWTNPGTSFPFTSAAFRLDLTTLKTRSCEFPNGVTSDQPAVDGSIEFNNRTFPLKCFQQDIILPMVTGKCEP